MKPVAVDYGRFKLAHPEQKTDYIPEMRRFALVRAEDVSGTSGVGVVAEGVLFANGTVAMSWLTKYTSTTIFHSIDLVEKIHGHEGRTWVEWLD